ncbi:MAG TPA: NAD(P)-dependent oxidoreductase [Blastocatellia bacterium]|nr:NAD(P)-dependent oxidoreductase [Blastocatellia bacterium]
MTPRILNAEPENYSAEARAILAQAGDLVEEVVRQSDLPARVKDFDALIVRLGLRVTREVLEASSRLKFVVTATTGVDHIDMNAASQLGVQVLSLRGEYQFLRRIPATAEHTWGLLLSLVRRIPWAFEHVLSGDWERDLFRGHDLAGKRLGILGLGRIGERVANLGLAFGMEVAAYDPHREAWPAGVARADSAEDLLNRAQVLSIHLPLTEATTGYLSAELLSCLPAGAWVVNTSRGAVMDENALVAALEDGRIAGAAVDVICGEQPSELRRRSPLIEYAARSSNLIITPHIGGATFESMQRTEVFMAERLARYLKDDAARVTTT